MDELHSSSVLLTVLRWQRSFHFSCTMPPVVQVQF